VGKVFKVEMLPAGHGDCIVIEYGESEPPHRVLVDGGPYYGFKHLAKRVDRLVSSGLVFELIVVTHVDCDHIDGAIKLLGSRPTTLSVEDIWFNAWEHLPERPEDEMGPPHGEMLSALIQEYRFPWNRAFNGGAVSVKAGTGITQVPLNGGLKLTLLSPTPKELEDLRPVWDREVREAGLEPNSRTEALELLRKNIRLRPPEKDEMGDRTPDIEVLASEEFEPETTESNASSIAFLAEYESPRARKSCLFAGDAHPDVVESSIRALLDERGEQRLDLDALKLSHHGSKHNITPALLQLLDCKQFLISTNGKRFKHPDQEAIAKLIVENDPQVELFFNYRSETTRVWENPPLQEDYDYKVHYPLQKDRGLEIHL